MSSHSTIRPQVSDVVNLRHGTVGTGFKTCLDRSGYNLMVIDCLNSVYPSIDLVQNCECIFQHCPSKYLRSYMGRQSYL